MSVVEEKKQERTKAKLQVTKASRRLTGAVERKADVDVLTVLMVELEKVFDDFCVIDEEYETLVSEEEHADHQVVNGLDIIAYRANVKEAYTVARNAFMQAKAPKTSNVVHPGSVPTPAAPLHIQQNKVLHYQHKELLGQKTMLAQINQPVMWSLHLHRHRM